MLHSTDLISVSLRAVCLSAMLIVSCARSEIEQSLDRVDTVLENKDIYRAEFEDNASKLRRRLANAGTDSLRWEKAEDLFWAYFHNQLDSCDRYLYMMRNFCSNDRQRFETEMARVRMDFLKGDNEQAVRRFRAVDPMSVPDELMDLYLTSARALYNHLWKMSDDSLSRAAYQDTLAFYLKQSIALDTVTFSGIRSMAQLARIEGDIDKAIEIYERLFSQPDAKLHAKAAIAYNIASIYNQEGCREEYIKWLVNAAEADFQAANRDYLALYELALLLEDGQLDRAERFINLNLTDVLAGDFRLRIPNSGKAQMIISNASIQRNKTRVMWLAAGLGGLSVMCLIICFLLVYSSRQRRKLAKSREIILLVNEQLKKVNAELNDAILIKDGYVFRYMELSVKYLETYDQYRHDLLKLFKSEGINAVVKELRSPSKMYIEYDNFYRIFDETFLGLYPDFVHKVNLLLREDARFPETRSKSLPTELRILAVIRIGITQSGKIATFLKCSPATVYTYRTKLRNAAICPKENFESAVAQL